MPKKLIAVFLVCAMLSAAFLAGCNSQSAPVASSGLEAPAPLDTASGEAEAPDPLGKYEEPVTVTVWGGKDDSVQFVEGEDWENNLWTEHYKEKLNINVEYLWLVDATQVDQQVALSVASQSLPDIMSFARSTQMQSMTTLKEADQFADLSAVYEQYATDLTKQILNYDGGVGLASGYSGDVMYALPAVNPSTDTAYMLWYRKDWLEQAEKEIPKTTDELMELAAAFAGADFGGQDTYGIAVWNELFTDLCGLDGVFNGFSAYPEAWIQDGSGSLRYGGVQPESKLALEALAKLYADGHLDKEFIVKDANAVATDLTSGKVGIVSGPQWLPIWPLNAGVGTADGYDWVSAPPPTPDGSDASPLVPIGVNNYYVVNKDFAHPEALMKMMNLYVEDAFGGGDRSYFVTGEKYHEPFKLANIALMQPDKNIQCWKLVSDAVENGNTAPLDENLEAKAYYEAIVNFQGDPADSTGWAYQRIFGPGGSIGILDEYEQKDLLIINEFYGPVTPTMETKLATLDKMQLETYTKIITGEQSVDSFDEFAAQWFSLGGTEITAEVNEWYQNK